MASDVDPVWSQFASDILKAIAAPQNHENVGYIMSWFRNEESPESHTDGTNIGDYNPLNLEKTDTTEGEVDFDSWATGVRKVANLLVNGPYEQYRVIVRVLQKGDATIQEYVSAVKASPWAWGRYNSNSVYPTNQNTDSRPKSEGNTYDTLEDVVEGVFDNYEYYASAIIHPGVVDEPYDGGAVDGADNPGGGEDDVDDSDYDEDYSGNLMIERYALTRRVGPFTNPPLDPADDYAQITGNRFYRGYIEEWPYDTTKDSDSVPLIPDNERYKLNFLYNPNAITIRHATTNAEDLEVLQDPDPELPQLGKFDPTKGMEIDFTIVLNRGAVRRVSSEERLTPRWSNFLHVPWAPPTGIISDVRILDKILSFGYGGPQGVMYGFMPAVRVRFSKHGGGALPPLGFGAFIVKATTTYVRFNVDMVPTRCEIDLTMRAFVNMPKLKPVAGRVFTGGRVGPTIAAYYGRTVGDGIGLGSDPWYTNPFAERLDYTGHGRPTGTTRGDED